LPPGEYRLQVKAPGLVTAERRTDVWMDDGLPSRIQIPAVGCVEARALMWPDQNITGTVRDREGIPVADVTVRADALVEITELERMTMRTAITDKDGRYVLPRLHNGTYIVSVDAADNIEPYGLTFYPSVHTPEAAMRIPLEGESPSSIDITVDSPRNMVNMTLRVVLPDGNPVAGVAVHLTKEKLEKSFHTVYTDTLGEAKIRLFEHDQYTAHTFWNKAAEGHLIDYESGSIRLIASEDPVVTIQLKPSEAKRR
jgi:5-hydroxyisourate hydrolase-like protein (transthyretin family)